MEVDFSPVSVGASVLEVLPTSRCGAEIGGG